MLTTSRRSLASLSQFLYAEANPLRALRIIAAAYMVYAVPTMAAWDWCWYQVSTSSGHSIDLGLTIGGLLGQLVHVALLIAVVAGRSTRLAHVLGLVSLSARTSTTRGYWLLGLILVVSVLGSRAVGAGLTQAGRPAASFTCDSCWAWNIVWSGRRDTGCAASG